jgi:chitin disaccharide deacetylase
MERRALVVCADDFAASEAISAGILDLALRRRISAISCLCVAEAWPEHGPALTRQAVEVEIGLHLALTEYAPLGPMPRLAPGGRLPSWRRLLLAAYTKALDLAEIAVELARQLDAFEAVTGRPPAFLDGHHHVHILPGIRDVVLDLIVARGLADRLWVRSTCEPLAEIARRRTAVGKAAGLAQAGRVLRRRLDAAGIACNDRFRGVTDLGSAARIPELFRRFLRGSGERPLLMCHPARRAGPAGDQLATQREEEFAYLASDGFARDVEAAELEVAPWQRPLTSAPSRDRGFR